MKIPGRIEVLRLAAAAETDPRSAEKALRGEPVKGLAGERLAREMAKAGASREPERPSSPPPRAA